MTLRNIIQLSVIVASALAFLPGPVVAQRESLKEQIVGSWMIVSAITTRSDGSKIDTFGPSPKGLQIFERNGGTSAIITAISGDELTITIPAGSGGGTGESKWKRIN
jgi:Lipocalin-like domain